MISCVGQIYLHCQAPSHLFPARNHTQAWSRSHTQAGRKKTGASLVSGRRRPAPQLRACDQRWHGIPAPSTLLLHLRSLGALTPPPFAASPKSEPHPNIRKTVPAHASITRCHPSSTPNASLDANVPTGSRKPVTVCRAARPARSAKTGRGGVRRHRKNSVAGGRPGTHH